MKLVNNVQHKLKFAQKGPCGTVTRVTEYCPLIYSTAFSFRLLSINAAYTTSHIIIIPLHCTTRSLANTMTTY